MADVIALLDQIADLQAQKDMLAVEKQALIDSVIPADVREKLQDIEIEFAGKVELVDEKINALTQEVQERVLKQGATVKGTYLRATYNRGRVSWDTKGLDGYAQAHPEILKFRKVGEPYVSLLRVK